MRFRSFFDKVIKFFVLIFITPVLRILSKMQAQIIERILFHLNERLHTHYFFSLIHRPKDNFEEGYQPIDLDHKVNPTIIVIQGPIITDNDFTINTIKLYRQMFPTLEIVFSTWSDESSSNISKLKKLGADVIVSDKPNISGFLNFNFQRKSTKEGLERAKKSGAKFVLKTRSDQRVNNRYAISLLHALINKFPSNEDLECKYRIFFISLFSLNNIPFHLSDMFQFGHIDDLIELWNAPEHKKNIDRNSFETNLLGELTIEQIIKNDLTLPEVSLGRHYAQRFYGIDCLNEPLVIFNRLLKEAVGIVDKSQLDLFWPKYRAFDEHRDYRLPKNHQHLSFSKWITLESDLSNDVLNYDEYSKS